MSFFDHLRSFGNALPIVGGTAKALWGDPAQEAQNAQMQNNIWQLQQARPEMINAHLNQMNATSNAFGPMNNLMAQMYGPGAQMDFSKLIQNPYSQSYMDQINQQGHQASKNLRLQQIKNMG